MGHREEEEPENVVFFQFAAPGKRTASYELQARNNQNPEEKHRCVETAGW